MKNCKGFSFAETIAAFSMWSLIVTILIPQLVLLTQERLNAQQSLQAYKILHEKTQQVFYDQAPKLNEQFVKDNVHYTLTWEEERNYSKACLSWKNSFEKTKSVCYLVT
ncbi:competence type IV pilus minor pilin ComGE [Metabacillus sp. Hm71]|uniref:competence type IV pilus minor pilin ComGE n=1 Tax=Metabacillus sp. Hm71 TaxID=3450743 RepID=UPI003F439838